MFCYKITILGGPWDKDNEFDTVSALMTDTILSGTILFPDGLSEGSIGIEDGKIEFLDLGDVTKSADCEIENGIISPALIDMHTHLGDLGARGVLPYTLEEVMFPEGLKHRYLRSANRDVLIASIGSSLRELSPGVSRTIDFREGGIAGMVQLREASGGKLPRVHGYGRPVKGDGLEELIRISDGLGIPSLERASIEVRQKCRTACKPYAIHASELYRENIGEVLDLSPDLLVHMVSGHVEDWKEVADRKIPTVICPRSNHAFSIDVPINEMIIQGLKLGIGTDNSISVRQDMFREMENAWMLLRSQGSDIDSISRKVFEICIGSEIPQEQLDLILPGLVNWTSKKWLGKGTDADLMVLDKKRFSDEPYEHIVRFCSQMDVIWTGAPKFPRL